MSTRTPRPRSASRFGALAAALTSAIGAHNNASAQETRGLAPVPLPADVVIDDIHSTFVSPGCRFVATVVVHNAGGSDATDITVRLNPPDGYNAVLTQVDLAILPAGAFMPIPFAVDADCVEGFAFLGATVYDNGLPADSSGSFILNQETELANNAFVYEAEPERAHQTEGRDGRWSAVGIRPLIGARSIELASRTCWRTAASSETTPDAPIAFVVRSPDDADLHTRVGGGFPGSYAIEAQHAETLPHAGAVVGSFADGELIDVYQTHVEAGRRYQITLTPTGDDDLDLFGFDPSVSRAGREHASADGDSQVVGLNERVRFLARETGPMGFVVTNDSGDDAPYSLSIRELCLCDWSSDGNATIGDLLFFLGHWMDADPHTDLNLDGDANILDLLLFLECFYAGC